MNLAGVNVMDSSETWQVIIDGPERQQLESHLMKIKENERQIIFLTAAKILSKCPSPDAHESSSTGLALGKVQSGKTGSFISLTALAFDNRYRVVIILAGTKNNLLDQTRKRVHKQLNLDYRTDRKIASLTTLGNIDGVQEQEVLAILESGNNVLITILKHHEHINHVSQIFSSPELSHFPTLIIDDEGDQASLNNKRKKGQSSTYREIRQLKNSFKLHGFVAFTATPQANLLIETFDDLSPEFCVLIEPGSGYTGGSTFHGENQEKYVKIIPESDIPFEDIIPESLLKALGQYFVGAALRTLRGDGDYHSMLVHTSVSKSDHHNVGSKVKAVIDKWKATMNLTDTDPAREPIEKYLRLSYESLKISQKDYPEWTEVFGQIKEEMKQLRTWIVNSSPTAEIPTEKLNLKNNIFIGGNMLERGVTLEGLAITYITRRAKESQADTVEQRARWFGYKRSYLDVCRVYVPVDVKTGFANLLGDEDDLWYSLKQNEEEGLPIKLWPRVIQCSSPFRPTRTSVAPTETVKYDKWIIQTKIELSSSIAIKNIEIVNQYFGKINVKLCDFGGTRHFVAFDCNLKDLYDNLVSRITTTRKDDEELETMKILVSRILKANNDQKIDVVFMNQKEIRERTYSNNKIEQLMQGHNKKYVGDRNLFTDPREHVNEFQLQVNMIQPKNKDNNILIDLTVALALNISDEIKEDLGRFVKPSGK